MRADLPPGPGYPPLVHATGFWKRPLSWLETCRARYGKRFTTQFPLSPPFVVLSDPDDVKQVFTAPPDVLHPGQGARILEPIVGSNSVLLLDEDAHMSQRKLMLPAFHGERMERLTGLVAEVAEREVESWPRGTAIALHLGHRQSVDFDFFGESFFKIIDRRNSHRRTVKRGRPNNWT